MQATRTNLSQSVTDELLRLISEGELRPGDRLPTERGLMEMFGVGRNTVREAVQSLVAMGIIEVRPRVGATIKPVKGRGAVDALALSTLLDGRTAIDIHEFRLVMEVEIAARAAERATAEQIEAIREAAARYSYAADNRLLTYREDIAFHQRIAEASGNSIYSHVLSTVSELLISTRRETDHVPGAVERARREHDAIYEAIRDRDAARAESTMRQHIESARWAVERALGSGTSDAQAR